MIPLSITVATRMLSKNAHNENLNNCGAVKKNSVFKIVLNKTGKNQRNPDVLVKGGDYDATSIVGCDIVKKEVVRYKL